MGCLYSTMGWNDYAHRGRSDDLYLLYWDFDRRSRVSSSSILRTPLRKQHWASHLLLLTAPWDLVKFPVNRRLLMFRPSLKEQLPWTLQIVDPYHYFLCWVSYLKLTWETFYFIIYKSIIPFLTTSGALPKASQPLSGALLAATDRATNGTNKFFFCLLPCTHSSQGKF